MFNYEEILQQIKTADCIADLEDAFALIDAEDERTNGAGLTTSQYNAACEARDEREEFINNEWGADSFYAELNREYYTFENLGIRTNY